MRNSLTFQEFHLRNRVIYKVTQLQPPLISSIRAGLCTASTSKMKTLAQHLKGRGCSIQSINGRNVKKIGENLFVQKKDLTVMSTPKVLSLKTEGKQKIFDFIGKKAGDFASHALFQRNSIKIKEKVQKNESSRVVNLSDDQYHYMNILINPKITSFYELLHIHLDIVSSFPYYSRLGVDTNTEKIVLFEVNPSKKNECLCRISDHVQEYLNLPLSADLEAIIPYFSPVFYSKRTVSCMNNLIIINFETIKQQESTLFRPGITKTLQSLAPHFRIILTVSSYKLGQEVLELCKKERIKTSAIYTICMNKAVQNTRIANYSRIFEDFHCASPNKQSLILTSHCIWDVENLEKNVLVGEKIGLTIKIYADQLSIDTAEFPRSPMQIIINHNRLSENFELFKKIARFLILALSQTYQQRENFDFQNILSTKFGLTRTNLPQLALTTILDRQNGGKSLTPLGCLCEVHNKFIVKKLKTTRKNRFIL